MGNGSGKNANEPVPLLDGDIKGAPSLNSYTGLHGIITCVLIGLRYCAHVRV